VIKTVVTSFIRDQSGAAEFDGMTVFLLAVVFPIAMYFMYSTASSMLFLLGLPTRHTSGKHDEGGANIFD
jgi:hypothetical protein